MTIYIVQGRYRPHQSKLSEKYGTSKDKYIDQKRKILHLDVHIVSDGQQWKMEVNITM